MKLYLVQPPRNHQSKTYEYFLGFVICAESAYEARDISFTPSVKITGDQELGSLHWVSKMSKHLLEVKYLGTADDSLDKGKIFESFKYAQ